MKINPCRFEFCDFSCVKPLLSFCVGLQCLSASSILASHGMSQEVGVTVGDFSFLCPALLNQIDGGACILHGDAAGHGERGGSPLTGRDVYERFEFCVLQLNQF